MAENTRIVLIDQIKRALAQLWLYKEFGESRLMGIENRAEILNSVSEFAFNALQAKEKKSKTSLENALVKLSELRYRYITDAERVLGQIWSELSPGSCDLIDQDKLDVLESLVESVIQEIQLRQNFEQARYGTN